jgi:Rieske 2Fe-2S family protein
MLHQAKYGAGTGATPRRRRGGLATVRPARYALAMTRAPRSPLSPREVAATRLPLERASQLPPRVFHDPAVWDYEREAWFARDWVCVAREEDAAAAGEYVLAEVAGERLLVVRGADGALRAFFDVCRHRGAMLVEGDAGRAARFQCPYHAWVYDLEGRLTRAPHTRELVDFEPDHNGLLPVRLATWQGLVFVSLAPEGPGLLQQLADLPPHLASYRLAELRRARRVDYEVAADWKVVAQNYSECYHCPGVHPQLNRLTPYDVGGNYAAQGSWAGGWMELTEGFETLSVDGLRHGRPLLPGWSAARDGRRVYYFVVWPNLFVSLFPDYLMTHQVWPREAGRAWIRCEWSFPPQAMARPDFDPAGVVDFWDLTNRQDWHVCELVQQGTGSRAYSAGRYAYMEDMVHAFDLLLADRYAADGQVTREAPRLDKFRGARRAPQARGQASSTRPSRTRSG